MASKDKQKVEEKKNDSSLIFEMTAEEKEELQKQVQKEPTKPKSPKKTKKRVPAKKEENWLVSLINFLKDLFLGKKSRSSTFFIRRDMKKALEDFKPLFYDANIEKLRDTFPLYFYDIYVFLRDLRLLFDEVYSKDVDFNHDIFFLNFIDNLLDEDDKRVLYSLNSFYFQEIISTNNNPNQVLEDIINDLKEKIEQNSKDAIVHYTSYFERLLELSRFGFTDFFIVFDPHFKDARDYSKNFQPQFGDTGLEEIKKLNTALRLIDYDLVPENIIIHFDDTIKKLKDSIDQILTNKTIDEGTKDYAKSTLNKIKNNNGKKLAEYHKKINLINKKKVLEALIRLMSKHYEYKPTNPIKNSGFMFDRYIKLTIDKINYLYDKAYEEIKYTLMIKKLLNFYNVPSEQQLSFAGNYTKEVGDRLEERGVTGLQYILITSHFKTFYERMYKANIRKQINTLLIEGDFLNKKEQSLFSEAYYNFDKLTDVFIAMDTEMTEGERDMGQIIRFAHGEISDPSFQVVIQRKINDLESRLRKILKEGIKLISIFHHYINWVVEDFKKGKSTFVNNIKNIGGASNKAFLSQLATANDNFKQFLEIVDSYPEKITIMDE